MFTDGTSMPAHSRRAVVMGTQPRLVFSVSETAQMLGTSDITLYRAISDGHFPAIRIRGRLVIPAKAIDAMVNAAVERQTVVDAADWVEGRRAA